MQLVFLVCGEWCVKLFVLTMFLNNFPNYEKSIKRLWFWLSTCRNCDVKIGIYFTVYFIFPNSEIWMWEMELFKYVDLNIISTQFRTPRSECEKWNDVNEIIANIGNINNNCNIIIDYNNALRHLNVGNNNFNIFRIVRYYFWITGYKNMWIKICDLNDIYQIIYWYGELELISSWFDDWCFKIFVLTMFWIIPD